MQTKKTGQISAHIAFRRQQCALRAIFAFKIIFNNHFENCVHTTHVHTGLHLLGPCVDRRHIKKIEIVKKKTAHFWCETPWIPIFWFFFFFFSFSWRENIFFDFVNIRCVAPSMCKDSRLPRIQYFTKRNDLYIYKL